MNNKISNPLLKQLIAEIAGKANQGRINDLSWGAIYETKQKALRKEADEKSPDTSAEDKGGKDLPPLGKTDAPTGGEKTSEKGGGLPPIGGEKPAPSAPKKDTAQQPKPADKPAAPTADKPKDAGADQEEADKAKEDAAKAKAELEKAKAEKAAAEKELEQNKYVKLTSSGGTQFLLGKVVDHAFKTGEIDALAGEMVEKLKIKTPEDMGAFSKDMVTYMNIPGMPELISSMKAMATKTPEKSEEQPA